MGSAGHYVKKNICKTTHSSLIITRIIAKNNRNENKWIYLGIYQTLEEENKNR